MAAFELSGFSLARSLSSLGQRLICQSRKKLTHQAFVGSSSEPSINGSDKSAQRNHCLTSEAKRHSRQEQLLSLGDAYGQYHDIESTGTLKSVDAPGIGAYRLVMSPINRSEELSGLEQDSAQQSSAAQRLSSQSSEPPESFVDKNFHSQMPKPLSSGIEYQSKRFKARWIEPEDTLTNVQRRRAGMPYTGTWARLPYVTVDQVVHTSEDTNPPEDSTGDRSAAEALPAILNRFDPTDISVPNAAMGVYANLTISEYRLRLYALVWEEESLGEPELSLVLILGPTADSYLPIGTELNIREHNLLNSGQHMRWTSHPSYLYTQVYGDWAEKFTVEIRLPNARPVALPSLSFKPETDPVEAPNTEAMEDWG